MRCPRCRAENDAAARFCEDCGVRLDLTCPSCGAAVGVASSNPRTARFASPESYTPKHLAERVLTSKAALEGERKR